MKDNDQGETCFRCFETFFSYLYEDKGGTAVSWLAWCICLA